MTKHLGLFVTIEGCEGMGKTTQAGLLAEYLRQVRRPLDVLQTREPGGTAGANAIRDLLLAGEGDRWDGVSELMLFLAARRDHVRHVVGPWLSARDHVVVCDRFVDTTLAYQGYGRGVSRDVILSLNRLVCEDVRPDLTIVLDGNTTVGLARARARRGTADRFEAADVPFHERARAGFLEIAARNPHRCVVVSVDGLGVVEVHGLVLPVVLDLLRRREQDVA